MNTCLKSFKRDYMVNIVSKETEKNRKIVTGEIIIRKFNIRRSACEQRSLKTIENFFPL